MSLRMRCVLPVIAVALAPACTGSAAPAPHPGTAGSLPGPPAGRCCRLVAVRGVVTIVGGPVVAGARSRLEPHQQLRILHDGTVVRRIHADATGRFETRLRPGVYTLAPVWITPRHLHVGTTPMLVKLTVHAM
jgi:hypothetical protein